MPEIRIQDKNFNFEIVKKSVRNISLKIIDSHQFQISAPKLLPDFVIMRFLRGHLDWIYHHSSKFPDSINFSTLTSIKIIDQNYKLTFVLGQRDSLVIIGNSINIITRSLGTTHLRQLFNTHLRSLALRLINTHLRDLKTSYPFNYQKVSVKNQASRFGSCSSTNNLNFNWQIIFFPLPQFRHILIHELCHTVHHDHSPRFWNLVRSLDPDTTQHRLWLKTEAKKFMMFS